MDTSDTQVQDWRAELRSQGRTLTWLAANTGVPRRTVYAYSQRTRPTPELWLAKVRVALGREVTP